MSSGKPLHPTIEHDTPHFRLPYTPPEIQVEPPESEDHESQPSLVTHDRVPQLTASTVDVEDSIALPDNVDNVVGYDVQEDGDMRRLSLAFSKTSISSPYPTPGLQSVHDARRRDTGPDDGHSPTSPLTPAVSAPSMSGSLNDLACGVGVILPQKIYRPHTQSDRRRYVEEVPLEPPIFFNMQNPDGIGISCGDALNSKFMRLTGRDDRMFGDRGPSVSIRLMWPGYSPGVVRFLPETSECRLHPSHAPSWRRMSQRR